MQMAASGSPPTAAGGAIADGTYHLTSIDVYPPSLPSSSPIRTTVRFAGNQLEFATGGGTLISYTNYAISTSGTVLTLIGTCPVIAPSSTPYSATATALMVYNGPDVIQTYAKQ
jgi:hypothetical protein